MPKFIRKRAGTKISIVLLSIFLFLFMVSSIAYADTPMLGDVNEDGEIDVRDVTLVLRHVLDIEELDEDVEHLADVDGDGDIDVQDVTLIMQYALGIIDEFPIDLAEVVSVRAIDRTTIEVELSEDVVAAVAEDVDFYEVTVGNESVEVEDVDYDADDNEAILEVDMEGKSGVLMVNGVEADEEVPPIPDFTEISATEAALEITMHFNTPVYLDDDLEPGDDIRLEVDGEDVGDEFEVDAPDSRDDAEDEFILEITDKDFRPGANDSVRVDLDIEAAEKIFNIWDEPMEQPRVYITNATPDDENPLFEDIAAFEDSYLVVAYFSKPVNTTGEDVNAEVTGTDAVGTPFEYTGVIDALEQDDEQEALRIELDNDEAIPEGAEITVRFPTAEGRKIEDRAGNRLAGTYTRSTTAIPGPTLEDASASDLSFDADDQEQEFAVTLVGDMNKGQELIIYLNEGDTEKIDYSSNDNDYDVDGADGDLSVDGEKIVFEADEDISDGTTITITAEDVDTTGVTEDDDDLKIVFERSEVGATAEAEFNVIFGLSNLSITAESEDSEFSGLASGQEDHIMTFEFTLRGELEDGESVEIDVSNLVGAGVSFDDDELSSDDAVDLEMDNDTIVVTAEGDISTGDNITVEAEGVDVSVGSAAEDVEVTFTRSDSGFTATEEIDIVKSFVDVSVSEIAATENVPMVVMFTLDGGVDSFRYLTRVDLDYGNANIDFDDATIEVVSDGIASISSAGVITYYSPVGGLDDGTEVTIQVGEIDASGVLDSEGEARFRRMDSGYAVIAEYDIIN